MKKFVKETLSEEAMGGVSSPGATLANVPGVGDAVPAGASGNTDGAEGSGDKWGDSSIGIATQGGKVVKEGNMNPYDPIAAMMAGKMGVPQVFKRGDSRTNTVKQEIYDEAEQQPFELMSVEDYVKSQQISKGPTSIVKGSKKKKSKKVNEDTKFNIGTLDDYQKASEHVPDHPLTSVKKKKPALIKEDTIRDEQALKDVNAKPELEKLGIAFEFKPAKSGKNRTFIKTPIKEVLELIAKSEWEDYGKNPENTVRKWLMGDNVLTIYADGKDRPRATLTKKDEQEVAESFVVKKVVSNSLFPYMK